MLPNTLKQAFVHFLRTEYFDKIETIYIQVYEEDLDEFKIIEEIQISPSSHPNN